MPKYDIWQARCDVQSEWDGGGICIETTMTIRDALDSVRELQIGGHAAWFAEHGDGATDASHG